MAPHLVKWQKEFEEQGLTVIEVDDGRIDALADLEEHVQQEKLPFAVLHDAHGELTASYGIQAYPTAYLMGRDGRVLWEGHPIPSDREQIVQALRQGR